MPTRGALHVFLCKWHKFTPGTSMLCQSYLAPSGCHWPHVCLSSRRNCLKWPAKLESSTVCVHFASAPRLCNHTRPVPAQPPSFLPPCLPLPPPPALLYLATSTSPPSSAPARPSPTSTWTRARSSTTPCSTRARRVTSIGWVRATRGGTGGGSGEGGGGTRPAGSTAPTGWVRAVLRCR